MGARKDIDLLTDELDDIRHRRALDLAADIDRAIAIGEEMATIAFDALTRKAMRIAVLKDEREGLKVELHAATLAADARARLGAALVAQQASCFDASCPLPATRIVRIKARRPEADAARPHPVQLVCDAHAAGLDTVDLRQAPALRAIYAAWPAEELARANRLATKAREKARAALETGGKS